MRLLLANALMATVMMASCLPNLWPEESDDSPDLLTIEYLLRIAELCGQPTSISLSGPDTAACAYGISNSMIYDSDASNYLTGSTFSGHPNLECRIPGSTSNLSAAYNSWYLSDSANPPQGYAPVFLFQHELIFSGGNYSGVTQFSSYSSGDILICVCSPNGSCGATDTKASGLYQIIQAN